MKINKYIAIIAITLFFTSCEKDDDTVVAVQTSNIQVIVEPFGSIPTIDYMGAPGMATVDMELGFRLTEFSTTYNGSDINILYNGSTYTIPAGDTEVLLGSSTSVNVEIVPSTAVPFNGLQEMVQVVVDLEDVNFEIDVVNRPSDLVVLKGEAGSVIGTINATLYNQLPTVTAGQVNFLFDWNPNHSAGNDLDLRVRMMPGDVAIEYSGSVSNYEDVDIADSDIDGMYQIKADAWSTTGATDPIDGIVFAMHPDGTLEIFETDLTGISSGGISEEVVLVNVTKTTDAGTGVVTYTLSQ